MIARVFTEKWIGEVRQRCEKKPRHLRPFGYFIATEAEYQPIREEIEELVTELPRTSQKRVITHLRNPTQCRHTYHELVIRTLLKERGLSINEYEPPIGGATPDWRVTTKDGSEALIIDVFTKDVPPPEEPRTAQFNDLWCRLHELRTGAGVWVRLKVNKAYFDSRQNDLVVEEVRKWFERENSKVGAKLCFSGLEFEMITRHSGTPRPFFIRFSEWGSVSPTPLRRKLEQKTNKYSALASRNGIPLLVGVVADIRTGYDKEEFENILLGQLVTDVAIDKTSGAVSISGTRRESNSLFAERPDLSGAVWAWRSQAGKWVMKGYSNPHARSPLCCEFSKAICSAPAETDVGGRNG